MIAITVSDATRESAEWCAAKLREHSHAVRLFEADGHGGPLMERLILAGEITAVLDLTISELVFHRVLVGPDRLTAAAIKGIPQVIGLGGLEAVESAEVMDALGKEIAEKACAAKGFTRIVLSKAMSPAIMALQESIRNWVHPPELLNEDLEVALIQMLKTTKPTDSVGGGTA